jgi:glycosyltransferase involved in cell wall biosynthesis
LLTVSRTLAQILASTGISPRKIVVIPNGADDPSNTNINPVKGAPAFHGRTVIGFVGFVRAWHKLDWLFDLVSREGSRRNLHLLVVGDGAGLSAAADLLGDRVTITGAVQPDDVSKFLNEMDIAVQPSATPYSSPIKIFEYMAHGRAIVAPDMPNFREILDRDCALFFEPQDQAAFEAAILHLCDHPALRASMGEAARQSYLIRRLSWENAAERVKLAALDCLSQHLQADAVGGQCS